MNHAIRIWLIVLGIMFGSQALGAEPNNKPISPANLEAARASFQRGVELFHEGNFQAALAEFQKANLKGPSYRILYNIAQTYYELHDYVSALKHFKQYLTNGDADVPAARKTQVEEMIQKLQTRIAHLEISVNVEGAQVSVDDAPVGLSPLTGPVPVNPGPRRVLVTKAGMLSASRSITVAGADRAEISLELRAASPSLSSAESAASLRSASLTKRATAPQSRAPLVAGLIVTGACAITTGVFAWLTVDAKKNLDRDLDTYQVPPNKVNEDRTRVRSFALVTDIAAVATALSGGLSLYLALTHSGGGTSEVVQPRPRLTLTPTLNGVTLHGGW